MSKFVSNSSKFLVAAGILSLGASTTACQKKDEGLGSGSYAAKVAKINAGKKEVYFEYGGKRHEVYLKDDTKLLKASAAEFEEIKTGQKIMLTVEKMENGKLYPKTLVILE